ncbi:MAG: hypothetical protein VKK04_16285 [Synechococcales bacterium]|nr:hypothetical protein [Synechococcales bacterium]
MPSLDQSLQELPPLGLHRPLGQTVQPLQPPPPLGPQVQLQPLPPLGSVNSPLVQMEAIAPHLLGSQDSPDANPSNDAPDAELPDTASDASPTTEEPTSPSPNTKPSLQRQTLESAKPANDLPVSTSEDTQAIASPFPSTTSPSEATPPTDEGNSPQTPPSPGNSTNLTESGDLSPAPEPPAEAESLPTVQPSLQFKEESAVSPDQEGGSGEQVQKEGADNDQTTPAESVPKPDSPTKSSNSETVQLSPDANSQLPTATQEISTPTTEVSDTAASSPSAESPAVSEPAAAQPQSSTSEQTKVSLKPDKSPTEAGPSLQSKLDPPLPENDGRSPTTIELNEPEAIAPSNLTSEDDLSASTNAPQVEQQSNLQLKPVTQSLDTSDQTASFDETSGETSDNGAIASDVPPAENLETTAPTSPQIQRRTEEQSANEPPSPPLGQTQPLIQKEDIFLSRYQTEFDQSDTFAETPPEPSDPLEPNPVAPDPNEPIHLLTLPEDTPIPDCWSDLSELVITDEINSPDEKLDSPPFSSPTQAVRSEDSVPSSMDDGQSGQAYASQRPHPTTFAAKTPPSTTLASHVPASNPAEPAEATIPVAWSSLTELTNQYSIESSNQNIQQLSSPQSLSIIQPEIQQPSQAESIEINDVTMDLLTRQVYQGVRSRLILEQEKHWGRSTHPLPWFAVSGSPSLKYLERASIPESLSTQNLSTINSLDLLNEEIYQLLRQRLEIERERLGWGAIAHV